MNKITIEDIRNLKPCYDPSKYLPEDWVGTVEDILLIEECPPNDRIWVALMLVPRFIAECFAIDCAFAARAYAASDDAVSYASSAASVSAASVSASASASASAYASAYYASSAAAYAYAVASASASAYDYAFARKQERENQIDALLMLLGGDDD